jgi:fatty-acyl-CoA synthase
MGEYNLAQVHEVVAGAVPARDCIVAGERRLSYADVTERTRRLASFLQAQGLGCHRERADLEPWESGQDLVALYLYNGPEYLEAMLGCFKARAVPFNVNYRYVEKELDYLFRDSGARAVVFHSEFAPAVDALRRAHRGLSVLIQVPDASGHALLPSATWYDDALALGKPERPELAWSPDDLYVVYTGGTTGMPKAVLWRQADMLVAAMGGRRPDGGENTLDDYRERALRGGRGFLVVPPLMHGAAQWVAFNQFHAGNTVVLPRETRRLDPDDVWCTVERERAAGIVIVGDAFARPLLDQLERERYSLDSLGAIFSGGAVLSARSKQAFLAAIPGVRIVDVVGSSETGSQGEAVTKPGERAQTGGFAPRRGACVLSADLTRELAPGDPEVGWLAQEGRVPLGYMGDPGKTRRTFPIVGGRRFSVPGDRARRSADGGIELLGRESVTINSGGEKIFAEEVELALKQHAAVYDAIVCDRPSERWGREVVAVVRLRDGASASPRDLLEECGRHLARYKWPRAFAFRPEIRRSPSGKPDYAWAREQAAAPDVVEA